MDKTAVKIVTYFSNLEEFLIGVLFLTLPFGWGFSIVPLVLVTIILLVNAITRPQKPSKEKLLYFLPPIAMFIWNTISLLYTENIGHGLSILSTQLTLIIATSAFLFNKIPSSTIYKSIFMFLIGCLCSVALLYGMAFFNSSSIIGNAYIFSPFFDNMKPCMLDTDVNGNYFLGREFSNLIHPAYYAIMLSMAMVLILERLRSNSKSNAYPNFWLFVFAIFGIALIQLSFNGTLILAAVIILLTLGVLSVWKIYYLEHSRTLYFIVLIFFGFLIINPQTLSHTDNKLNDSIMLRTKVTKASLQVISENWLTGVGIGDGCDEMKHIYKEMCEGAMAKKRYNSHNQFLTSWIQSGIIGVILLIWSFATVSRRAFRKKSLLLHLFGIIFIVSFLFESILVRYWGVLTYIIFYSMLYFYSESLEDKGKIKPICKE